MSSRRRNTTWALSLPAATTVGAWALFSAPVQALQFDKGDWLFNLDTTLTAAAQWRTESRNRDMANAEEGLNFNDGNNNFDPGLISAKGSFILEFGGEYKDFSFFLRADGLYDYVYADQDTDMTPQRYESYNGAIINGGTVKLGDFPRETVEEHGRRTRLLDAFATYSFNVGNQSGTVRLGRQVISWGEGTFIQGVNALQNPLDAGVARAPGAELKEFILPTAALNLKWAFNDSFSAEAYYKLDWEKSTLNGVGSYLSASDTTGPGAQRILLGPLGAADVIQAVKPDDDDQYGIALRYLSDRGDNFDVSYTKSHANIPGAQIVVDLANRDNSFSREVYLEDIEVWQFSTSFLVSEAQVYADLAYSDNAPFVNTDQVFDAGRLTVSDVERGHYWQVVAGMTDIYTALKWLSPSITLIAEAVYQGNNKGGDDLEDTTYVVTEDAWGYRLRGELNYYSVLPGMDLKVPIFFSHDVDGYGNGNAMNNALTEDVKTLSIGVDAFYLTNWQFSANYAWFFGNDDPADRTLDDRDNFSVSVKYTF